MVFPPAALIEIAGGKGGKEEENEKNSVESLHATLEVQRTEENTAVGRGAEEEEEDGKNTPLRYVPLSDVYSATSPCVSSASGGSKKVKPPHHQHWKPLDHFDGHDHHPPKTHELLSSTAVMNSSNSYNNNAGRRKPPITHFYTRRDKGKRKHEEDEEREKEPLNSDTWQNSLLEGLNSTVSKATEEGFVEESGELIPKRRKKRKSGGYELVNLGVDSSALVDRDGSGLREAQNTNFVGSDVRNKSSSVEINIVNNNSGEMRRRKNKADTENEVKQSGSLRKKKWVWLSFSGIDPMKFVGLECKVFWPLDADWYRGHVIGYDFETRRHNVEYDDGDKEKLMLSNERVKFYLSSEEMQHLKLKLTDKSSEADGIDVDEMVVLAASLDDCQELEPGDIIWAKLTGHAMWPAVVLDESLVGERLGLNKHAGEKSGLVQFFGTHDFARVKPKQVISFLKGLLSSFHLKCRKPNFVRSLEEARMYLSEQKLPKRMLRLRDGSQDDDSSSHGGEDEGNADSGEACGGTIRSFPFDVGDLQIVNLGKIVKDSDNFHDEKFIWPEGYAALRKFPSITDPSVYTTYKMEVLRDDAMRSRPLFRVTSENGEQFSGATPSACWNKIYKRMRKIQPDGLKAADGSERVFESGVDMFGFSHPEISKLIEDLSTSRFHSKARKMATAKCQDHPPGYRPVDVTWRDLDKCNVCHMDEEYENNLFLQCEKCRMMVHARCYGELEPLDGVLWLCNLCRPGAPEFPPRCCLCPVTGGAMKPTTDGRWAHLACAIWIPETCLSDIKKMEPIDGLSRINKDRWKLLCSICGVSYGACIQCSNNSCRVAYHPLCARAAGFCVELEDEDRLHLIPLDEDEEDQCIRLLSFCKRHRPPSNLRPAAEERIRKAFDFSDYTPPINPSGCARTEPYNHFGRRGRKEPEALAAASLKRLYVENRPHLVGGFSHHDPFGSNVSSRKRAGCEYSVDLHNMKISKLDASGGILSKAEKYRYMRETFRKRLAFGKSGIHGFGIFARHPHKAGDMVIEYTGELVRPSIADRREHLIYNSLVGAGTYMFRINDERVIDATRAGSIAHLINHSCEPNCYSRVISVNGDEHIIIFAKRDITQWEELTYDYRFVATDEQLACYCGFPRCRGVVNDPEAEERAAKLYVPRSELIEWRGE